MRPSLSCTDVSFSYAGKSRSSILENFDISISKFRVLSLVGPSGCGKSTLLKLIAGVVKPDCGVIQLNGEKILGASPRRPLVFQEYALFDWLSVIENVRFALRNRISGRKEQLSTAISFLSSVGLADVANEWPRTLSGGMRQRLALARCFAADPSVLLQDEPFSSLDFATREEVYHIFLEQLHRNNASSIIVTHDVAEAIHLSDCVLVVDGPPLRCVGVFEIDLETNVDGSYYQSRAFLRIQEEITQCIKREKEKSRS